LAKADSFPEYPEVRSYWTQLVYMRNKYMLIFPKRMAMRNFLQNKSVYLALYNLLDNT